MTVDEFVEKYKELDEAGKNSLLNDLITTEYVSYATKVADCKRIIQSTSYTNTEPNMFCISSPTRKMLFTVQLIDRYTEIDIDHREALNIYDKLAENKILENLINALPKDEVLWYKDILDMMFEDFKINERSIVGYLDSKLASLGIIGEELNKIVSEVSV